MSSSSKRARTELIELIADSSGTSHDVASEIASFFTDKMFVCNIRTMAACYDIHCLVDTFVFDNKEEAVEKCRHLFIETVRKRFRSAGGTEIYGVEFDPDKVESYESGHYADLWNTGDCRTAHSQPGGPATAQVMEFARPADGSSQWEQLGVVYQLPKNSSRRHTRAALYQGQVMIESPSDEKS